MTPSPLTEKVRACVREAETALRQAIVSQLQSLLRDLGLERKAKTVPDLAAYVARTSTEQDSGKGQQQGAGDGDG